MLNEHSRLDRAPVHLHAYNTIRGADDYTLVW